MDGIDTGVRSDGNFLMFFMRLNLIAWFRFSTLVLKEVLIRIGISDDFQENIDAFKRINEALLVYLHQLEQIDVKLFKEETEKYNKLIASFRLVKTDKEFTTILTNIYKEQGINQPWQGNFDEHMSNKDGTLVFM